MTIKTNQERATEDTHKRIKKKVKKIKKRIRKNATLTPQVARNTRGDANKYAPYPQFAYRPADSPTHILKSSVVQGAGKTSPGATKVAFFRPLLKKW